MITGMSLSIRKISPFEKQRDAQNKIRVQKLSGYKIETDDDIKEIVKELIKT